MTRYRYIKAPIRQVKRPRNLKTNVSWKYTPIVSKTLLISGILLIANVLWPILSYELFTAPSLRPRMFFSPVPPADSETVTKEKEAKKDLTRPQNWFPNASFPEKKEARITHYTLSIPKFDIVDALVKINGENLRESLIHYPGTALPGEIGAPVIFGHSILPQFFNPENYLSMFSLIPRLELGDEIIIKFDGITYIYRVIDKVEVKPDNISVLEQPYDNEYLRLITCTPPGTYLRRGVITAVLVD